MAEQQLSSKAQLALAVVNSLSPEEQAEVVSLTSANLAAKIAGAVQTSTPAQRAEASSALVEEVQAALAHGFKKVEAADGKAAIEVKIKRPDGTEETCLLSEGARGKLDDQLADYGKYELEGATLLSLADFRAVVKSLNSAIQGQKVVNGVLETEDTALNQAYQIVTQGVRTDGGCPRAVFDLDERGAVARYRVKDEFYPWGGNSARYYCALFGASPEELK